MRGLRSGRGAFIVFEGCDRAGKTTQCQRIIKYLNEKGANGCVTDSAAADKEAISKSDDVTTSAAKMMRFPDRSTQIGEVIDKYLKGSANLDDHVVHLLFSTNRWEKADELKQLLASGTHVIVDRYAFSGVAFSAAKPSMSMEWCRQPDRGLPKPDLVCFLDVSAEEAAKRGGFGEERYEKADFQKRVRQNYHQLIERDYWRIVDTDGKTPGSVFAEIRQIVDETIQKPKSDLSPLWPIQQ